MALFDVPPEAVGLRLYRFKKGAADAIPCEAVRFPRGAAAVERVLRLAAISGRVEIDGNVDDHFADVLDADQTILTTVALNSGSYRALKTKWMRCKVERR